METVLGPTLATLETHHRDVWKALHEFPQQRIESDICDVDNESYFPLYHKNCDNLRELLFQRNHSTKTLRYSGRTKTVMSV